MINDMIFMALRACIRNSLQLQDTTDQLPAGQPEEVEVTVAYQRDVAERLQKFFEAMGDPQTNPQSSPFLYMWYKPSKSRVVYDIAIPTLGGIHLLHLHSLKQYDDYCRTSCWYTFIIPITSVHYSWI